MTSDDKSEAIFGLVTPLGTNVDDILEKLDYCLKKAGMQNVVIITLSELLESIQKYNKNLVQKPEDERIRTYMKAGNDFRGDTRIDSALALLAILKIRRERFDRTQGRTRPLLRTAYVLKTLKHPGEVRQLREIYRKSFHLISVFSPEDVRVDYLTKKIQSTQPTANKMSYTQAKSVAYELIDIDESESDKLPSGQGVRKAFPNADVFIDASRSSTELERSLQRYVELILGSLEHTPTDDEFAMFIAHASARRSASLARQVGATITNSNGDLLSVGTNEVPRPGGGIATVDHSPEYRNIAKGFDESDVRRSYVLKDVLLKLQKLGYLKYEGDTDELANSILGNFKNTSLMNLIEFVREVHAEMDALTTASRNTVSVKGCTLYTTTFPCHDCTKHIISSGIKRVVYIEPYPKSLATDLFDELIAIGKSSFSDDKVSLEPFVGVAPSRYMELFGADERKGNDGKLRKWNSTVGELRYFESPSDYINREVEETTKLTKAMDENNIPIDNIF